MSRLPLRLLAVSLAALVCACAASHTNVKPPPPRGNAGRPVSDPPPSRVVLHATVFRDALVKRLAETLPRQGEGEAELLAGQRLRYTWQREPVALRFDRGRIFITVPVLARYHLLGERELPITVTVGGEPVVTADFKALLQSTDVQVHASGSVEALNRAVEAKLRGVLAKTLDEFRFDLRPILTGAFSRIAKPLEFQVGDQTACAELRIAALEAAPTVLADGVEKDLGVVVLPSVTLPCTPVSASASQGPASAATQPAAVATAPAGGTATAPAVAATPPTGAAPAPADTTASAAAQPAVVPASSSPGATQASTAAAHGGKAAAPALPLLANVASLPTGPFKVVVPVAARYEELSRALESSMHGQLHFSTNYPYLYLEKPEVYPSDDTIVIRMRLGGTAEIAGFPTTLGGELYFSGHPQVIDNQITVPDLDITPGTADELVKLKFALDYTSIRDQARNALRVDVSERLAAVREKLSTELSFDEGNGCVRAQVLRTEVTGIYPHPSYLRIYTQVDAQASIYMPCKR